MAFRKKWANIVALNPDIIVIQECESIAKFIDQFIIPKYNDFLWFGNNEHKGIGIISFNEYRIELSQDYTDQFKYVVPLKIKNEKPYKLFAIWAMPHKIKSLSYVGQIWAAINHYKINPLENNILIGDFNSNQIWDHERKNGNHTHVVNYLFDQSIVSLYHTLAKEKHGSETTNTLYLLKNLEKPYHMDYCFLSKQLISEQTTIKIGNHSEWLKFSDHMPLVIENIL